jgi:uncharacterized protein (TIGR00730 family)
MAALTAASAPAVCVFCGSARGARPEFADFARRLGGALATRGATLVYGGASIGLMGVVADAAMERGGKVIGVLPESLRQRELAHPLLSELRITPDLASRKLEMLAISDAFIVLPGGIGTLDELFEIWTLMQLGARRRPMVLINQLGYYDDLLAFLQRSVSEGFFQSTANDWLTVAADPETAVMRVLPARLTR